jgi:phosphatidylglycerol:prolipoprotein diacylglycerol transferase
LLFTIPWFRPEPIEVPNPFGDPIPIHVFGILVALGVLAGAALARRKAERDGVHPELVMNLAGWVLIPGFVVAHVFDDLAYRPWLVAEQPWHLFFFWDGISSFGGFAGAIAGALLWRWQRSLPTPARAERSPFRPTIGFAIEVLDAAVRALKARLGIGVPKEDRYEIPGLAFADPIAFAFPLGWMFGRTGCFVVHDHPGRVTDFFLGVEDYEVGSPPYQVRHDLGLYEVIWSAAVMLLFLALGRRPRPRGLYCALLPLLYAPVRFGLDFLRATDFSMADPRYFGLTPGHYAAALFLAIGVVVALGVRKTPWPEIPRWARWPEPPPEVLPPPPPAEPEGAGARETTDDE